MIYIHVGYGKTGTSSIQCYLANNRDKLKSYGFAYPCHPSDYNALRYKVNSGNGTILLNKSFVYDKNYHYIFSSENLFFAFLEVKHFENIVKMYDGGVHFIIYTRNLVPHFFSSYNQAIKRNGSTETILQFAKRYGVIYDYIYNLIKLCMTYKIAHTVMNYSNHCEYLNKSFIDIILPLKKENFYTNSIKLIKPVNRSLSKNELTLQRILNVIVHKKYSSKFSDFMVNNFKNKKIVKLNLNKTQSLYLKEKCRPKINKVNYNINEKERIVI